MLRFLPGQRVSYCCSSDACPGPQASRSLAALGVPRSTWPASLLPRGVSEIAR
jgi:hypothetical protein